MTKIFIRFILFLVLCPVFFAKIDDITISLIPADLLITGSYVDVFYSVTQSETPQQFELTFVREGPCGVLQNLLTGLPGQAITSGTYTVGLCDGDRVDNKIFVIGREVTSSALLFGTPVLTVLSDTVGPKPPNIDADSMDFPKTVYARDFKIYGNVDNSTPSGPPTTNPETAGSVTVFYDDPTHSSGRRVIGGGLIQPDSSFVAIVDMASIATGDTKELKIFATDPLSHDSNMRTLGNVTRGTGGNAAVSNPELLPPDGTLTNHSGVLIKGSVTGTVSPFTVKFYMNGFLNSEVSGLQSGADFSHSLNMTTEGKHCFAVEVENSNTPIYTSPRQELGCITLDLTPPAPPQILKPDPNQTLITKGPNFDIQGLTEPDQSPTNSLWPKLYFSGPSALSFSPVSPMEMQDANGNFKINVDIQNIPDGQHSIELRATDELDNTGPGSVSRVTFIKDTQSPIVEEIRVNNVSAPQLEPPIFVNSSSVRVSIRLNEDSVKAPNLYVTMKNGSEFAAGLFGGSAKNWEYSFAVPIGKDGPVNLRISGGADLAGNEISYSLDEVFHVDTKSPELLNMLPKEKSVLSKAPENFRLIFADEPQFADIRVSGVDTQSAIVRLIDPKGRNLDIQIIEFDPVTIDVFPLEDFTLEGDYRIELQISDKAGNQSYKESRFITMNFTAITADRISCFPEHNGHARYGVLPFSDSKHYVEVIVDHPDFDELKSELVLKNFREIPQTITGTKSVQDETTIRLTLAQNLPKTNEKDGKYVIESQVYDVAGNHTRDHVCVFTYDNCAPSVKEIFPANGQVVSKNLRTASAILEDCVPRFDIEISDIDTTKSSIGLFKADDKGAKGEEILSRVRYESIPGERAQKVLLEITGPDGSTSNLPNDGSADGLYVVEVQALDKAGNASGVTSSVFHLDTQAPILIAENLQDGQIMAGGQYYIYGRTRDNDNGSDVEKVEIRVESVVQDIPETVLLTFTELQLSGKPLQPQAQNPAFRDWHYNLSLVTPTSTDAHITLRTWDKAGNYRDYTYKVRFVANHLPIPDKSHPYHGWTTNVFWINFNWERVAEAASYELEIITPAQNTKRYVTENLSLNLNLSNMSEGEGTYRWNIRALDSHDNPGPQSLNTNFTIDQTRPFVKTIQIQDPSPGSQGRITQGETRFLVTFSEEMDIRKVPLMRLVSMDAPAGDAGRKLEVLSFTGISLLGRVQIDAPGSGKEMTGLVRLLIENGVDLAQNRLLSIDSGLNLFEVNPGPYFDLKFFTNPVDPDHLTFVIKGFISPGGLGLEIPDIPAVIIVDSLNREMSMNVLRVTESAFTGTMDLKNVNHNNFFLRITGKDKYGNTAQRTISILMSKIFRSGAAVSLSLSELGLAVPESAVDKDNNLLMVPGDTIVQPQFSSELKLLATLPSLPTALQLSKSAILSGSSFPEATGVGLYVHNGRNWQHLTVEKDEAGSWKSRSGLLGPLAFFTDELGPTVQSLEANNGNKLRFSVSDAGSGVRDDSLIFCLDSGRELKADWNAKTEIAEINLPLGLSSGNGVLQVSDRVGNISRSVAVAFSVGSNLQFQPSLFPNPAKRTVNFKLNTNFSPDSAEMYIYDAVGRRVYFEQLSVLSGSDVFRWDLVDLRGRSVANGVYFMRLKVNFGDKVLREILKFAVIR